MDAEISDIRTHFSVDVSQIPVGETLQSVLQTTAQGFEEQIPHYDLFAREAAAVAARTNEPPLAGFEASPVNGPTPLEVTFHSTSSSPDLDPIESVEWDFGDGSTGTGDDVKHTYEADGTYTATLTISDGMSTAQSQQTISVGANSEEVSAADDSLETEEDTVGNVDVLANDTPAGALEVIESTDGASGTVSCDPSGCGYDPAQDFNGSDSFTYTVSDGESQATATVSVTVSPVNDPPVAEARRRDAVAGRDRRRHRRAGQRHPRPRRRGRSDPDADRTRRPAARHRRRASPPAKTQERPATPLKPATTAMTSSNTRFATTARLGAPHSLRDRPRRHP